MRCKSKAGTRIVLHSQLKTVPTNLSLCDSKKKSEMVCGEKAKPGSELYSIPDFTFSNLIFRSATLHSLSTFLCEKSSGRDHDKFSILRCEFLKLKKMSLPLLFCVRKAQVVIRASILRSEFLGLRKF